MVNSLAIGDLSVVVSSYFTNRKYRRPRDLRTNENITGVADGYDNVVLIIGETAVPKRFSLYGYPHLTTPYLERWIEEGNACYFDSVHAAAPITRDSISMTLSFQTPENIFPLFEEKSVIELAQENGYRVSWLGSQPVKGLHESSYGFLAAKSDYIDFTDWDDIELPSLLNKTFQQFPAQASKNFIILHMLGSHAPYHERIGSFTPENDLYDDYDITIAKTDFVLNEIDAVLQEKLGNYTLLFLSDHGEIIGKGHGMMAAENKDQYLIPYIVRSTEHSQNVCDFTESLRNENGFISGLSNKFLLLKMLGYQLDDSYRQKEISNDRVLHPDGKVYRWEDVPVQQ